MTSGCSRTMSRYSSNDAFPVLLAIVAEVRVADAALPEWLYPWTCKFPPIEAAPASLSTWGAATFKFSSEFRTRRMGTGLMRECQPCALAGPKFVPASVMREKREGRIMS